MRVDISIAIAMTPIWVRRALADRNSTKARGARFELVERIASAIERRFAVTWRGSADADENARPVEEGGPLFGGPDFRDPCTVQPPYPCESVDSEQGRVEHKGNN